MTRSVIAIAFTSLLHGCFLLATAMGCDDQFPGTANPECEAIEDAVADADRAVLDAVRDRPRGADVALVPVRLAGRISDRGAPVERAAVRLTLEGATLAVVRTDPDGRFDLTALVEEPTCEALRLLVARDDGRASEPAEPGCVDGTLDYDFDARAWTVGSEAGVARASTALPGVRRAGARRSRTGSTPPAAPR